MSRPLWFLAAWSMGVAIALVACSGAEAPLDAPNGPQSQLRLDAPLDKVADAGKAP